MQLFMASHLKCIAMHFKCDAMVVSQVDDKTRVQLMARECNPGPFCQSRDFEIEFAKSRD